MSVSAPTARAFAGSLGSTVRAVASKPRIVWSGTISYPSGNAGERSERGARRVILIVAITLRRQHGAIGSNETHAAEGRVEDLARKVQVRLIRIEVHCRSAHFQRVLAGDDGTGKHGEPPAPSRGVYSWRGSMMVPFSSAR